MTVDDERSFKMGEIHVAPGMVLISLILLALAVAFWRGIDPGSKESDGFDTAKPPVDVPQGPELIETLLKGDL